jgi:hypothetical protein
MVDLLFNKEENGTQELKKLLGFIDADLDYDNLESDLFSATLSMQKTISKEVYSKVLDLYLADENPDPVQEKKDSQFIYMVRYPIVVSAYTNYVAVNDLSHTNDGRKARIDEYEKTAFEWQIKSNNTALERRFYKALDNLLEYLDENSEEWKESENYKRAHKTLIRSTFDFNDVLPLDSRYLFEKLVPGLKQSEDFDIIPRIGENLLEELKREVKIENQELYTCIRYAMVYKSMAWGMRRLSVNLFPEGILTSYSLNKNYHEKRTQTDESEEAAQRYEADAKQYLIQIESIIKKRNTTIISSQKVENKFRFDDTDNFVNT